MQKIGILGAGIAGLSAAIALRKIGYEPLIFEAVQEIKPVGAGLGLGANAIKAFQKLDISDQVINAGRQLDVFDVLDEKGFIITHTDNLALSKKYGINNFVIERSKLHEVLSMNIPAATIFKNKRAIKFEYVNDQIQVFFQDQTHEVFDILIVADGIHSSIRNQLDPSAKLRYAGYTCWRALIEDSSNLNIHKSSETWGRSGRFGIVPLANNKIYWFACINSSLNNMKMKSFKIEDLINHFKDYHDPICKILQQTSNDQLIWNDIIDLAPLNKFAYGKILLIGDAAHATTPNLGQGACQAIEDAAVLYQEIQKKSDVAEAFIQFEKRRLVRTQWIVKTSWNIGKLAQMESFLGITFRNILLRNLPASVNNKQIEKLYKTDF